MADKIWYNGDWFFDGSLDSWCYLKPGYYNPGEMHTTEDLQYSITSNAIRSLIVGLDKAGWIKPRLDERLRTEDLKITHRLLDLLERR